MTGQPLFDLTGQRVFVAGHGGMVGRALVRRLAKEPCEVLTVPRSQLDLTRQSDVESWFAQNNPDVVIVAAAKVGGIKANDSQPVSFLSENLSIASNVIQAAWQHQVRKLLYLGAACLYPREAAQPIAESALLGGSLEPTNQWYAVAKIAGLKLCQAYRRQHGADFISAIPANLYGPGDSFDPENSHVIPSLIAKMHRARQEGHSHVTLWGTGTPVRDFLYVDDLADALVYLLGHYAQEEPINIGCGAGLTIKELARSVAAVVGYQGDLRFDPSKPDGMPRKVLDSTRMSALGWQPGIGLLTGLEQTYAWYQARQEDL
ncbi:GDP-L-fucose synthase [Magnetospira sp. QH-2]|uniref:GDP-L-fucose synthase family protein n=1 Tax=Magnetospira sp. (strain QH-2) TaxID=1288970 RepID=UPI0003E80FDD|nr:GDP-L-fucose synthase [Magnetospira sp. QH-2]CCQ73097.1 bifunctional GDP-fucose synthetase: GDP-4-dehydro-6-deoxy-D-mannose epimerase and GDP-4-dehydro-6-L-deoxygalactose reductase [Magnetospira sp. QH-2]